jgi:multidrug resistance efflux pump
MKQLLGIFIVCILGLAAFGVYYITRGEDTVAEEIPTAQVQRGAFTVGVSEVGVLKALKSTSVSPSFTGRYWGRTLSRIVDEETMVKEGDPIAWLDTTEVEQRKLEWESRLKGYRAMKDKQLERLNLQKKESEVQVKTSRADRDFAQTELEEADAQLSKLETLLKGGLVAEKAVRDQRKLSRNKKYALVRAESTLEGALIRQKAQESVIGAEILEAESRLKNAEKWMKQIEDELAGAVVRAPVAGMVLHGTSGRNKIKEGDMVHPYYPLAMIPDLSEFRIASQVEEVEIDRVHVGQKADVTVDALPDLEFSGEIEYVNQLATPRESSVGAGFVDEQERTGVRVFETLLKMEGADKALRPGMTVGINLIVRKLDDVLHIPSAGVFKRGESSFVYLKEGDQVVTQDVVLGERNDKAVVVVDGLKEGDEVLLEEPTQPLEKVRGVPLASR